MAVLLNQTSNLRLRLDLVRRLSDGANAPASLEMRVGIDRYQHREGGEHAFVSMIRVNRATLLDMDLIQFLQGLEELLDGRVQEAALEATVDPAIGLRLQGGPEAFLAEVLSSWPAERVEEFFDAEIEKRRDSPRDDLIPQLAAAKIDGQPITDPFAQPGFPGFDGMSASVSLSMLPKPS